MPYLERLRAELAQRIAADIAETCCDWTRARDNALEQARLSLGEVALRAQPDSAQIESAVRAHFALFAPEAHRADLAQKRTLAYQLLVGPLAPFDAYLTGAVLNGAAHADSNICLEVFDDDVKAVEVALMQAAIDFEPVSAPTGAMPEPLESLGFVLAPRRDRPAQGVRVDIYSTKHIGRNPYRRLPDAHQADWEAAGRICGAALAQTAGICAESSLRMVITTI